MHVFVSYYRFIILVLFPKKSLRAGRSWEVETEKLKDILWPDHHYGDLEVHSVGDQQELYKIYVGIVLLNDRNSGHLFADFLLHWLRVLPKALILPLRLH